jgi:hypothetical protein
MRDSGAAGLTGEVYLVRGWEKRLLEFVAERYARSRPNRPYDIALAKLPKPFGKPKEPLPAEHHDTEF